MSNPNNNSVFVIIPAYNEAPSLRAVASGLLQNAFTLVIVDDGSKERLSRCLEGLDNIYYLRHKINLGQGAALQTGIQFALAKGAEYLVTFDADGQHSTNDIPALLAPLVNKQADITLGSRFLEKGMHNAGLLRKWILQAGRVVNFLFTGLYLSDAHNGIRAIAAPAARKINLVENRMAHATEFLLAIRKNKLRWKEVPVSVSYTDYSKKKGQSVFNSIRIFFDLVLHKLFR